MHSHFDEGLGQVDSNVNLNYLIQETTTVVTGNCGSGTFKVREMKASWEKHGIGTNAIHLAGFDDARKEVMGREECGATPEETE